MMLTGACPRAITAGPVRLFSMTSNNSFPSTSRSSRMGTENVRFVCPGRNDSVPLAGMKSRNGIAADEFFVHAERREGEAHRAVVIHDGDVSHRCVVEQCAARHIREGQLKDFVRLEQCV